jgi:hypothetical protein
MSDRANDITITPEQAAMIDQRLGQAFAFLRDVLDNPGVLEEIPDGAMLRHRDVVLPETGVYVRLTAYRTEGAPHWSATVTGISVNGAHAPALPVIQVGGTTPEAAFDALETALLRLTEASITSP